MRPTATIASGVKGATPPSHLNFVGLDEEDAAVQIKAAGDVDAGGVEDLLLHVGRVAIDDHGVIVYDAKDAVIVVQHAGPVFDRSQIVTDVDSAAGLDTAKYLWVF